MWMISAIAVDHKNPLFVYFITYVHVLYLLYR
jgi:hypothetical protein